MTLVLPPGTKLGKPGEVIAYGTGDSPLAQEHAGDTPGITLAGDDADVPDDKTAAAMFTVHRLDDATRHLAHASQRLDQARATDGGLRDHHLDRLVHNLQRTLDAGHALAASLDGNYPDEAGELKALAGTIGLAWDDPELRKAVWENEPRDPEGRWFHGTQAVLKPGDVITSAASRKARPNWKASTNGYAYASANVIRARQLAYQLAEERKDQGPPRIYQVEPLGAMELDPVDDVPSAYRTQAGLRVVRELSDEESRRLRNEEHEQGPGQYAMASATVSGQLDLANAVSPAAKSATFAHLVQTLLNHTSHTMRHAQAMVKDAGNGDEEAYRFDGEHARTHLDGGQSHAAKLRTHLQDNYPQEARLLAGLADPPADTHLANPGTVSAQIADPETISSQAFQPLRQ